MNTVAKNWMVIEVLERKLLTTKLCANKKEAIDQANDLLKEHIKNIDCEAQLVEIQEAQGSNPNARTDKEGVQFASEREPEAWCNWKDQNWDTHITQI